MVPEEDSHLIAKYLFQIPYINSVLKVAPNMAPICFLLPTWPVQFFLAILRALFRQVDHLRNFKRTHRLDKVHRPVKSQPHKPIFAIA